MAITTSKIVIEEFNNYAKIVSEQGLIPWSMVVEACSFFDASLARELYPDLVKELTTSATKLSVPPVRLFDLSTKEFPIGLLQKVRQTLVEQGIVVEIEKKCSPPSAGYQFEWYGPEPRAYQLATVETVLNSSRYGIIVSPTGSGKTLLAAKLIQQLGLRTIWIVHSLDLVKQTANFLRQYLGIVAGEFGGSQRHMGSVIVCMAGKSLRKAIATMMQWEWEPGLVIIDESHRTTYKELQDLNHIPAYYRYAMTATPFRSGPDELVLEAAYGQEVARVSMDELQEIGLLAKVQVEVIEVPLEEKISNKGATWEEVYRPGIVEHEGRNKRIREKVKELVDRGLQVLVDVEELDHIDQLNLKEFLGDQIEEVTGSDSTEIREDRYNRFREQKLKVLIGTVLREGIDLPTASAIVLAGGKKSKVRLLQEIGRGLRTATNKSECIVVDTIDQQHYLLFQHCQQRLRTMVSAGFSVPEGVIRQIQLDIDQDSDTDIQKLKERQEIARYKRIAKEARKHNDD